MYAVTEAVMHLPAAADDLRLGGANALAEFYIGHRQSIDLDFFAMEAGGLEDPDGLGNHLLPGQVAGDDGNVHPPSVLACTLAPWRAASRR